MCRQRPVLQSLGHIAAEDHQLNGTDISLGDLHLSPTIACFTLPDEGAALLREFPALQGRWQAVSGRHSLLQADPFAAL